MNDNHSPYHYVNLDKKAWSKWSDEVMNRAEQQAKASSQQSSMPTWSTQRDIIAERLEEVESYAREVKSDQEKWCRIVTEMFKYPDHLSEVQDQNKRYKNICIIGGGIAGLTAAYELTMRNHNVTLLEASDRFGGRIRTHRFDDGTYGELGAMRIPKSHGCVLHYIEEFNLKTRIFVAQNNWAYLHLRGKSVRYADWEQLVDLYKLNEPTAKVLKEKHPLEYTDDLMDKLAASRVCVKHLEDIFKKFTIPRGFPRVFEERTLEQILRNAHPEKWKHLTPDRLRRGHSHLDNDTVYLGDEAYEYLGRVTGMLWFERTSFLQFWLNELPVKEPCRYELEGGMDTLVTAFIDKIKEAPGNTLMRTKSSVTNVKLHGNEVEVAWQSEDAHMSDTFDYVICTCPAQATTLIKFEPPLAPAKSAALTNLSYARAAKTIVHCTQRFWELEPDKIFGGGSASDLPHQHCWYPSDNSKQAEDTATDEKFLPYDGSLICGDPMPTKWQAVNPRLSEQAGVFTAAYMWGNNARRFAHLDNNQRTEMILSSIEKLHGHPIRQYIKDVTKDVIHYNWDAAWAFFAPGEQSRYQAALCKPHFDNSRQARVFFAGEHLPIVHAWIQSAIQSALRAVMDVLDAP